MELPEIGLPQFIPGTIDARDVQVSPFGSRIALYDTSEINGVRMLDADLNELWRVRLQAYWAGTWSGGNIIDFLPDGSAVLLPSVRTEGDVCLCNPDTGEAISYIDALENQVYTLAASPDGKRILTASNSEIVIWTRDGSDGAGANANWRETLRFPNFAPSIHAARFLPDGDHLALATGGSRDRELVIYNVSGESLERVFGYGLSDSNISHQFYEIAVSPDGQWLISAYRERLFFFRRPQGAGPEGFQLFQEIPDTEPGNITTLAITPDGMTVFTGHFRFIQSFRFNGSRWERHDLHPTQQTVARDIAVSPDGQSLFVASHADENAAARYALSGSGPDPRAAVVNALGGQISPAQRSVLSSAVARELIDQLPPGALAPRDLFETLPEYEARLATAAGQIRLALAQRTEDHWNAQRREVPGTVYEVSIPLQERGTYDIDALSYTTRALDAAVSVNLERVVAQALYRDWTNARLVFTLVPDTNAPDRSTPGASRESRGATASATYTDPRLRIPGFADYPVRMDQHPLTGERLDQGLQRLAPVRVGTDLTIRNLRLNALAPTPARGAGEALLGSMLLENTGTGVISDLGLQFSLDGAGSRSQVARLPASLAAGQSVSVELPLDASLLPRASAQARTDTLTLRISYRRGDRRTEESVQRTLTILGRNALQWDDDLRVGAFVQPGAPTVVDWSGQIIAAQTVDASAALTPNILSAMALFAAMGEAGVRYVVDPNSAYEVLSRERRAVDFLRFPQETLSSGIGDCDDLSVLYASLLEAAGVATAFLTTPGHILVAVDSGIAPDAVPLLYGDSERFILREGRAWLPVETTAVGGPFGSAWEAGLTEWRSAGSEAGFFTTASAFERYRPVALDESPALPASPATAVASALPGQVDAVRDPVVSRLLRDALADPRGGEPAGLNRQGVILASWGQLDAALAQFDRAIADGPSVAALINRATALERAGQSALARDSLTRALALDPGNPRALLGMAFSFWAEGNRSEAERWYAQLEAQSPFLAGRYPLPESGSAAETGRAGQPTSPLADTWTLD